jgi:hypothetical protein
LKIEESVKLTEASLFVLMMNDGDDRGVSPGWCGSRSPPNTLLGESLDPLEGMISLVWLWELHGPLIRGARCSALTNSRRGI